MITKTFQKVSYGGQRMKSDCSKVSRRFRKELDSVSAILAIATAQQAGRIQVLRKTLRDGARHEFDMSPDAQLRQGAKTPSSQECKMTLSLPLCLFASLRNSKCAKTQRDKGRKERMQVDSSPTID
ncbi:MAG TPA: hypothetical protein VH370_17390 [Humisphaera sp.]|jgi:hypothetical protein|nr:hypothetical protein [Humisphaera sp.]